MYEITTLENGIKVVSENIPFVRSISFGIWVKVGSQNEDLNINGISHFIEHMIFKGTSKRSAKDIAEQMDEIGGQINAFTTKQMTCFYFKILDKNFDKALEIMSDMFLNSSFSDEEMEREKQVIIEEINMYEDTPEELVFELMQQEVFNGSSLAWPILGSIENVKSFSHDKLRSYYEKNYVGKNIIISIAGNFETQSILKKIDNYFGAVKNKEVSDKKIKTEYKSKFITKKKISSKCIFV